MRDESKARAFTAKRIAKLEADNLKLRGECDTCKEGMQALTLKCDKMKKQLEKVLLCVCVCVCVCVSLVICACPCEPRCAFTF
jgi:hypothetical protein